MAILSKGITLTMGEDNKELSNLQEIPELGGEAEAIEITTLADDAHIYMEGIKNYGDSLTFKFLYEKEQFALLESTKTSQFWKVNLPDGAACNFEGTCSVKLDSVGVNAPLTYTLSIRPSSAMGWE